MRILAASIVGVALLSPVLLRADVKTQERTQVKFEGAIGRVVNIFGGRTARDGVGQHGRPQGRPHAVDHG